MSVHFDVAIIGAGPGGYVAALRAAQLGLRVVCIDSAKNEQNKPAPGGTCGNVGCIPSKTLLESSAHYEMAARHFAGHGIEVQGLSLNLDKMQARKTAVVMQGNEGILFLFRKNKVTYYNGFASFSGTDKNGYAIVVAGADLKEEEKNLTAQHVIIATGSQPRSLPGAPFDEKRILSNTGALALDKLPKKLGVIGAGVVGLELGSLWRRLGSEVTILESQSVFLPAVDQQIAGQAYASLTSQGLAIELGVTVSAVSVSGKGVTMTYQNADAQQTKAVFDHVIVSIGRVPFTDGLGAEKVGLQLDERGFVVVDGLCKTNLPNVWAVGDVVGGAMLAHKASDEGIAVAERIAGKYGHVSYATIPWVIYTHPEIAWVGKTEEMLKEEGIAYHVGTFPFMANGRARAMDEKEGMVKILADARTDEVLGVHMIGPMVSELIAEMVTAMEFHATAEDMARICHAHPTLSEVVKEAALAVDKRALHY